MPESLERAELEHATGPASSIPVIDLAVLTAAAPGSADHDGADYDEAVRQVAGAIRAACHDTGFFYLSNHGVPEALVQDVLEANRRFHDLPEAEKLALKVNAWLRGYQPMASTQMRSSARFAPAAAPNQLESFIIADEFAPDHPHYKKRDFVGPNQWPDDAAFRETVEAYYAATKALAARLLPAMSVAVGKPPGFFGPFFDPPRATLRLVHYPPSPADRPADYLGIYPHTDYGFFTILAQDGTGGLEIQRVDGTWVEAAPIPGAFIVNIGDAAARWTNDVFNSSPHRVINKSTAHDRYSVALFFDPNHDTMIETLEEFVEDGAAAYPPIRYYDYYRERLNTNHPDRREAD